MSGSLTDREKADALIEFGECEDLEEARGYLEDMGQLEDDGTLDD